MIGMGRTTLLREAHDKGIILIAARWWTLKYENSEMYQREQEWADACLAEADRRCLMEAAIAKAAAERLEML